MLGAVTRQRPLMKYAPVSTAIPPPVILHADRAAAKCWCLHRAELANAPSPNIAMCRPGQQMLPPSQGGQRRHQARVERNMGMVVDELSGSDVTFENRGLELGRLHAQAVIVRQQTGTIASKM